MFDPFDRKRKGRAPVPGFEDIEPRAGDPRIPRDPDSRSSRPPGVLDEPLDVDDINPSIKKKTRERDDGWTEW